MRVTVCQLPDPGPSFEEAWSALAAHCRDERSELVLLPEMPFSPWIAAEPPTSVETWSDAVAEHERWLARLGELGDRPVVGTRPVGAGANRRNEVFVHEDRECRGVHRKVFLPDEAGFWEASWYGAGAPSFVPFAVAGTTAGALVCTELWFGEHARSLGRAGARLLLAPRATAAYSADKWVAGGRVAAVLSGAFCLSSNRGGGDRHGTAWAGQGWIVHPEEGELLALTDARRPFATLEVDLHDAERAQKTYPRYVT